MIITKLIFWLSLSALLYSYIGYPLILNIMARMKPVKNTAGTIDKYPQVSILIAAHNEELVIEEKLKSIFSGSYPIEQLEVFVGSDASTDKTDEIVNNLAKEFQNLHLVGFAGRTGKIGIINKLVELSKSPILIITDANVIFDNNTLVQLINNFNDKQIALVDSHMMHRLSNQSGASMGESFYVKQEVATKYNEGKLWGTMMGPFGGCYALRREYFKNVPSNFLVDDFYINMKVLEQGGKAVSEINALVYENISHKPTVEFKRKIRIATGSFQNLFAFFTLLFRLSAVSFCFFSHKVIRWFGPIFFLGIFFTCFAIAYESPFFAYIFWIEMLMLILIPIDYMLHYIGIHIRFMHILRYFFFTNLAVFIGMFKAIGGVSSSVWEPTKREAIK